MRRKESEGGREKKVRKLDGEGGSFGSNENGAMHIKLIPEKNKQGEICKVEMRCAEFFLVA